MRKEELEKSIAELDTSLSVTNTPDLYKERLRLKTELDLLLSTEAERLLLRSHGSLYEHGDKAGRLLAHQLKARQASNQIIQIRNESDTVVTDPVKINTSFKSFYRHLYKSESPGDETQMDAFFQKLDLPRVSPNDNQMLDAPLTLAEIKNAINSVNSGKSPGPDGYPVRFNKQFSNQLAPLLLEMFNYSYSHGSLPTTLTQASISLIHKKRQGPPKLCIIPANFPPTCRCENTRENFSSSLGAYYAFNHLERPNGVHWWEALFFQCQKASRRYSHSTLPYRS